MWVTTVKRATQRLKDRDTYNMHHLLLLLTRRQSTHRINAPVSLAKGIFLEYKLRLAVLTSPTHSTDDAVYPRRFLCAIWLTTAEYKVFILAPSLSVPLKWQQLTPLSKHQWRCNLPKQMFIRCLIISFSFIHPYFCEMNVCIFTVIEVSALFYVENHNQHFPISCNTNWLSCHKRKILIKSCTLILSDANLEKKKCDIFPYIQ
jgi:hypothetical protein